MKLILGGDGYIGSDIVNVLDNLKTPLRVLSRKKEKVISKKLLNTEFHFGSYSNRNDLNASLKNVECVYHLIHIFEENKTLNNNAENNLKYFKHFLNEAKKNSVKKIIYFSSAAVYGEKINEDSTVENSDLNPINNYGKIKLEIENVLVSFCKKNQINYLIVRTSSIFGKNFNGKVGKTIVHKLIHSLKKNELFTINGDGTSVRDYLHVNDLAKITVQLEMKNCIGIFNIGGKPFSINQIIALIEKNFNSKIKVRYGDKKEDEVLRLVLNSNKTMDILGKDFNDFQKLENEIQNTSK